MNEYFQNKDKGDNIVRKPLWCVTIICINTLIILTNFPISEASGSQVRAIYFVPNDRILQNQIHTQIDRQLKAVRTIYAEEMKRHGYGQHIFQLETDRNNKVITHRLIGRFADSYYRGDTLNRVEAEIRTRFDIRADIYVVFVDISNESIDGNSGVSRFEGGPVMVPASGLSLEGQQGVELIAHELGHAFNLIHDFRSQNYTMSYGFRRNRLSKCAATFLKVSPYFNGRRNANDRPATLTMNTKTTYPSDTSDWTLAFEVNDPDGLYQVQLELSTPSTQPSLIECVSVRNTETRKVLQFGLPDHATRAPICNVWLRVVDIRGNVDTQHWELTAERRRVGTQTTGEDGNKTALTLFYESANALTPTNPRAEWDGWVGTFWEKRPDGKIGEKPHFYLNHPNEKAWDHWFYMHAESQLVYDISDKAYTAFEAWFYIPNPCTASPPVASMEFICFADGTEIFHSGVLRGDKSPKTRLAFPIPEDTETLKIHITEGDNGVRCDHFILGIPKLIAKSTIERPMSKPTTPTPTGSMGRTDVNNDGVVNLVDLILVASRYGETIVGEINPNPDVNRDGIVDVKDINLVCAKMPVGSAPAAIPVETRLLPNYPNPCNPETWIPYTLNAPTDVSIEIYTIDGRLVRTLPIGFQNAGVYVQKTKAGYWDGRNGSGERVASGVYFYTLFTGDTFKTRKLLIRQ